MSVSGGNNFIAEWFGHRIHPTIAGVPQSVADQTAETCPFLSSVVGRRTECVKVPASRGVCTISSSSNGPRQDWLVCPHRALVPSVLNDAAMRLFGGGAGGPPHVLPAPALTQPKVRAAAETHLAKHRPLIVFFQEKLGGEISLAGTARSPEMAFDFTLVELTAQAKHFGVGRFGILEVQTMDFHGSYRHAVQNLQDALRLHERTFHHALANNPRWASEKIEGPNKSNVFKRTFYQLVFKFRLGMHPGCAGCILAIPTAVWDSWQPHLAAPKLEEGEGAIARLARPGTSARRGPRQESRCWIYVIEPDPNGRTSPNPLVIKRIIATDPDALSYYALTEAPDAAMEGVSIITARIRARLSELLGESLA